MTAKSQSREGGILTLDEFRRMPEEDAYRVELSRGRVVREPRPGAEHGVIVGRIVTLLGSHVEERGLGLVVTETGFLLAQEPPTVRGPDAAFVATDPDDDVPEGFWTVPPTLAVEVVSPTNTAREIHEKVLEYLEAGTAIVWVVDPPSRTVTIWRPPAEASIRREGQSLGAEEVLPELRLEVAWLFQRAGTPRGDAR